VPRGGQIAPLLPPEKIGGMKEVDKKIILALGVGPLPTENLLEAVAHPRRTVYHHLHKLQAAGLVRQPRRGLWELTGKGRAFLSSLGPPLEGFSDLKRVLEPMPEGFQALVRLALSAVVAKQKLFENFETGWPGFIVWGSTGLGKTFVGRVVGKLLGLGDVVKDCRTATERELLSRRVLVGSGRYAVVRSPYLDLPFLVLDEADKAQGEVRRGVFQLLQGDSYILIEGERVPHRMIPYVTLNLVQMSPDFEPYLRRCVAVNFDRLGLTREAVRTVVDSLTNLPRLALESLSPPGALSLEEKKLLEEVMGACAAEEALWDRLPLEIMALGRASFLGGDRVRAILDTCYDRLVALETLGATRENWRVRLHVFYRERLGQGTVILPLKPPALPPSKEEARLSFARRKSDLLNRVRALRSQIDAGLVESQGCPTAPELRAIREELKELEKEIKTSRDEARLAWEERVVKEREGLAGTLLKQLEEEKTRAKEERAIKKARLESLERLAKECRLYYQRKQTKPEEDVLGTLIRLGCARWETITWEEEVPLPRNKVLPTTVMITLTSLCQAFSVDEWEEYPVEKVFWLATQPTLEGAWARVILNRLRQGDRSVEFRGQVIRVRKPKIQVFEEILKREAKQLGPQKQKRRRKALFGLDGKEYQPEALTRWENPQVKTLLQRRMDELKIEIERLREGLPPSRSV